jgi:hypothetical protein
MRLSEVLELPDLKKREIAIIGVWDTGQAQYAVLARRGERLMPFPKLYQLIEIENNNVDPDIKPPEVKSILRRFGYFEPISNLP